MLMPTREEIMWIMVHNEMPEHPKIDPLSDAAFRLLVWWWCYCSRHNTDGKIAAAIWTKRGTKRTRDELVGAGLVDLLVDGDVEVHDYLDIQRSTAEIEQSKSARATAGILGNHRRWHLNRRTSDPNCPLCLKGVA